MSSAVFLFSSCGPKTDLPASLYQAAWKDARRGDLASATQEAERGLSKNSEPNSAWYWRFLTLKAELLMRQGLSEDALNLLKPEPPPALARSESALWRELTQAAALGYLERYQEAESVIRSAQIFAENFFPNLLGEVALRKGTIASLQWQFPAAQSNFSNALDIARSLGDKFLEASALGSLGVLAARMEHFDESVDWNTQGLALANSQSAMTLVSKIEGNTAWSTHELGDFQTAAVQYEKAEQHAILTDLRHERILWLTNSAVVHYELHDYAKAQQQAKEALKLALQIGDPADVIECYQNDALIAMQNSRLPDAHSDLREASRLAEKNPDSRRDLYTALLSANLDFRSGLFESAKPLYSSLARNLDAPSYLRWEAHAGLAQILAAQGDAKAAEREFELAITAISKARSEVGREELRFAFLSSAIRFYDLYVNFLIERNRPLDALKVADLSRAQTLESGLTVWVIGKNGSRVAQPVVSRAARAIRPQEIATKYRATLLFYWLGEDKSHLWVITPSKISLFTVPPRAELDAALTSYRETILKDPRDPLESGNSAGKKLYDALIRPAKEAIPQNARVIILTDNILSSLNFETLPVYEPRPHYWIEDVTVSIANSLSLLSRSGVEPPPASSKLLFLGDPIPPSPDYPRLADAEKEIRAVRQHFSEKNTKLFLGEEAKASAYFSSNPQNYSFLHFATHGTASAARPLESAIILTREGNAYKLYARDIVKRPLNAYLVSISACEGAGRGNFAGEGLIGLSWAFLRAGAHNVVAGLWEVTTASTPQIMDELYKGLQERKDPASALRDAKLALLHSKIAIYHRPLYWAPFQLYSGS